MNRKTPWLAAGMSLVLLAACSTSGSTPTQAVADAGHAVGTAHALQPKHLEAVIEIDMGEFYFGDPDGVQNPTFSLPAGKTVGIHIHNEGDVVHELAIGRDLQDGAYAELLTELVPSDLFFYYDEAKAEVEEAVFGELEVEPGLRDIWIRLEVPAELGGEWQLGCFVEGHYDSGMHAAMVFE